MSLSRGELERLRAKYQHLLELRQSLPRAGAGPAADANATRAALHALARAFPGALRELDTLPTEEIERRRDAVEAALAGAAVPPWLEWTSAYHRFMRAALVVKRLLVRGPLDEAAYARAAAAARAAVDGEHEAEDDAGIDDELVRAAARPPHGRLNVVVFAALSRRFGLPAAALWDALFPRRGNAARGYRD